MAEKGVKFFCSDERRGGVKGFGTMAFFAVGDFLSGAKGARAGKTELSITRRKSIRDGTGPSKRMGTKEILQPQGPVKMWSII